MPSRLPHAALSALIILQLVMLASLYAGLPPHPPRAIPLFAMAPFLAASMALAAASLLIGPLETRCGKSFSIAAALCALLSYGPQKWIDPAIGEIWPAVLLGQIAAIGIIAMIIITMRRTARPNTA